MALYSYWDSYLGFTSMDRRGKTFTVSIWEERQEISAGHWRRLKPGKGQEEGTQRDKRCYAMVFPSFFFFFAPHKCIRARTKVWRVATTENILSLLQMKQNTNLNMTCKGNSCYFIRPWAYHSAFDFLNGIHTLSPSLLLQPWFKPTSPLIWIFLTEVEWIYNIILVSGVQHSNSIVL